MPRLDINGLTINAQRTGVGPPVVLLHGFTGSSTTWNPLAETLAPHFEVIVFDIFGHGRSSSPNVVTHYRMRQCVNDIVAALRELGHQRATWLGYSMGARTALQVAVHHPDAVDGLALEGVTPGLADPEERAARVAADEELADRIERDGLEAFVDFWQSISLWDTQTGLSPETVAALRQQRMGNTEVGLANSLRGMGTGAQEPLHDRLHEVNVPALLLTGALDQKFTAIAREMAAEMPRAELCSVAGAGHAVHLEDPTAFQAAVADFLRRLHGREAPAG
jgi:2-succinyl-6-hydroxy-2,4-cyclohexadiene-1-carboxylate synthase